MDRNIKFYHVKTDYINYLKKFQNHIWANDEKGRLRPYIGIVIELNGCKYYAPLSSPKEKHGSMKDRLDFIRIDYKNELKCVINLNNIIPVNDDDLSIVDVDNEEELYKELLHIEIHEIRKKQEIITKNAKIIYNKITKHKNENLKLASVCYDFSLLEQKMSEYQILKEVATTSLNQI